MENCSSVQGDNIKVYVRLLPKRNEQVFARASSSTTITIASRVVTGTSNSYNGVDSVSYDSSTLAEPSPNTFTFDYVGDGNASQEAIFDQVGKPMVESCLDGYHGCIFAYGQTGSGKTYTIYGGYSSSETTRFEERGLTFRVIEYLFAKMARSKNEYSCKCSYLEIYQEKIKDLLADDGQARNLFIREDLKRDVYVEHLKEFAIDSEEDAQELLYYGAQRRHVAQTAANNQSSRSHTVFTLHVESKVLKEGGTKVRRYSRLHLVDLAGSERQKSTEATGLHLKEASVINQSLTTLGRVIRSLAQGKSKYVHYRDSKLTFLLKNSLGGNSKTSIIATIDPHVKSYEESLSTLKFAQRAKFIRNRVRINENVLRPTSRQQEAIKKLAMKEIPCMIDRKSEDVRSAAEEMLRRGVEAVSSEECRVVNLEALLKEAYQREERMKAEQYRCYGKIEDMQLLCLRRELYFRTLEHSLRLSEARTKRILECESGSAYKNELYREELRDLERRIEHLKYQLNQHPQILRLAIENMELREVLDQYIDLYEEEGQELKRLRESQGRLTSEVDRLIGEKHRLLESLCRYEDGCGGASGLEEWRRGEKRVLEMELEEYKHRAGEELSRMKDDMVVLEQDWNMSRSQLEKLAEMMKCHEVQHENEMKAMKVRHEEEIRALKMKCDEHVEGMEVIRKSEKNTLAIVLTMEQQIDKLSEENCSLKDYIAKLKSDYHREELDCGNLVPKDIVKCGVGDDVVGEVERCGEASLAGLTCPLLQMLEKTLLKHNRVITELQFEVCRIRKEKEIQLLSAVGDGCQDDDGVADDFLERKVVDLEGVRSEIERIMDDVVACKGELSGELVRNYADLLERVATGADKLDNVKIDVELDASADGLAIRDKNIEPLLEVVQERLRQRKLVIDSLRGEMNEMKDKRTEMLSQLVEKKRSCENMERDTESLKMVFELLRHRNDGKGGNQTCQEDRSQRCSKMQGLGDSEEDSLINEKGACEGSVSESGESHAQEWGARVAYEGVVSYNNQCIDKVFDEDYNRWEEGRGVANNCVSTNRQKRSFSPRVDHQNKRSCVTYI